METAGKYADSIKQGDYLHTNCNVTMELNAPVVIIPENIYKEDSSFIKLDTGIIYITSNLIEYKQDMNYNEQLTDVDLYDVYKVKLESMSLGLSH